MNIFFWSRGIECGDILCAVHVNGSLCASGVVSEFMEAQKGHHIGNHLYMSGQTINGGTLGTIHLWPFNFGDLWYYKHVVYMVC